MSTRDEVEHSEQVARRPSFTTLLVAGLILGLAWGLFFGPYGAWIKWIGDAYVGLLQMTVLPYVALSLVCSVGRLSPSQGGKLARAALGLLLILWTIGLVTVGVMSLAFPTWKTGSFFSTSMLQEPTQPDWLALFIPSNPFWSLTNNLVPAVVLFSVGLGVALIPIANKELLLDKLDVLNDALGRLNKLIVRMAPLGIFAIVAHTSGTLSMEQFHLLQGYLFVYMGAAVLLTFWVLPALISCFTPFSQREVLRASRDVLITAFIIGSTFVVLPMIVDAVKRMIEDIQLDTKQSFNAPQYTVQLAYPFPDIGRIINLVFIPFAAWFYGSQIDPASYPQLIGTGLIGAFAKPIVTIPLLLNLAELPADIFNLFLAVGVVVGRFGDLMKAMHLLAFSILLTCYFSGALRYNFPRLITRGLTTVVLFVIVVVSTRSYLLNSFSNEYHKEKLVAARQLLGVPVEATVLKNSAPNPDPIKDGEDRMDRIRRRGAIRIGVHTDKLPFSYYNEDGQLVGFDIDMAHQLARDLNVRIEFVPFTARVSDLLRADHFDVAMSGLEGTIRRAAELPEMEPYMEVTRAVVVPDHRRKGFRSLKGLTEELKDEKLRVAVVVGGIQSEVQSTDSVLGAGWGAVVTSGLAEHLETVELTSEREFFESQPPIAEVLATSAEVGSAWTLKYPHYSVVKPTGHDARTPLYYFVADKSQLREFLGSWLKLKRRNGTVQQLYDYWVLGMDLKGKSPRWCILRDVLHWVD